MADKFAFLTEAKKRVTVEPADLPADFAGGDTYFVRKLTARERDAFEASRQEIELKGKKTTGKLNLTDLRARLLVLALCDADGKRLFTDSDAADLSQALPGDLADKLFEQASRLAGMTASEDEEPEKNVASRTG